MEIGAGPRPHGIEAQLAKAGWTFFYMAGEVKKFAFGRDVGKRVSAAVGRVIRDVQGQRCNCLRLITWQPGPSWGYLIPAWRRTRAISRMGVSFVAADAGGRWSQYERPNPFTTNATGPQRVPGGGVVARPNPFLALPEPWMGRRTARDRTESRDHAYPEGQTYPG